MLWDFEGKKCEWDEEVCACACTSKCIQAAQPLQSCRRKGNELGERETGQKVSWKEQEDFVKLLFQ